MLVCVTWQRLLSKAREGLATKDSEQCLNQSLCDIRGENLKPNSVKFVLKHLAYDTVINLKIGPQKYVKYVKNDAGQRIRETTSLWLKK